jgi:hypothetical protein
MRADIHQVADILVSIHKSEYDTSGWFSISFDTKGWGDKEPKRSPDEVTWFTSECIEEVYERLINNLQKGMQVARADLAERKAKAKEAKA